MFGGCNHQGAPFHEGEQQVRERLGYLPAVTGRLANVETLSLDKTSLELNARGAPVYESISMQAGSNHVFVARDATLSLPLLHETADERRLAGENAGRYLETFKRAQCTPLGIIFTDPQITAVGQGYGALTKVGSDFAIGDVSFEDPGRARVAGEPRAALSSTATRPPAFCSAPR